MSVSAHFLLPSILCVFIDIFIRSHVQFESSAVMPQAPPSSTAIGGLSKVGGTRERRFACLFAVIGRFEFGSCFKSKTTSVCKM